MYRYNGEILVGDQFAWNPYGCEGWPHGYCHCEVTRIIETGGERLIATAIINGSGEPIHEVNQDATNDEEHFREHVKLYRRPSDGHGVS